ncbi:matrix-remodeling-associated protein 7 [Oxyura jamaicensis]|uniref:matrix-remodeling-associated protein 7 n=1 Tax=Oxyura jamaicensis TaxID=8884 RepID=UPI0015A613B9|nr:matrix-remodeling-associated protein 7 [Oxyura jamaicensis]
MWLFLDAGEQPLGDTEPGSWEHEGAATSFCGPPTLLDPAGSRPSPAAGRSGVAAHLRGGLRQGGSVAMDLYLAVPLLFTLLALVLASVFVRLRGTGGGGGGERLREAEEPGSAAEAAEGPEAEGGRVPVEEVGAGDEGKEAASERREGKENEKEGKEEAAAAAAAAERGPEAEPSPAETEGIPRQPPAAEPREAGQQQQEEEAAETKEEDPDSESEKLVVREPEDEDAADETFSFKYSPGKLRGNQYKSMMTKEELEEEQRVQREQLAAIFRLMKEKSDTFGEMSEGDMKEQLRLYDI